MKIDFQIIRCSKEKSGKISYELFDVRTENRLPEGYRFFWVSQEELFELEKIFCII